MEIKKYIQKIGAGPSYPVSVVEGQLDDDDLKVIEKIKGYDEKESVSIILDGESFLDNEKVRMVSYILDGEKPWIIDEDKGIMGYMAYVDNRTWDIQEIGSIGIVWWRNSMPRRVM
jgi:hypothetical protein